MLLKRILLAFYVVVFQGKLNFVIMMSTNEYFGEVTVFAFDVMMKTLWKLFLIVWSH